MLGISEAAESIGFRTRGYRLTWEQLRDEVPLPCIVHWNQRHFVVGYKVKKRRVWGREQGTRSHASRASRASHAGHASHASHASQENPKPDLKDPDESPLGDEAVPLSGMQDLQDHMTA